MEIQDNSITNSNFTLLEIPTVQVTASSPIGREGQEGTYYLFSRKGPTNNPLSVTFALSGAAQPRQDYIDFFVRRAVIPAGERSVKLPFTTVLDSRMEGLEELVLSVLTSTQTTKQVIEMGVTNSISIYYPGWELQPLGDSLVWTQTGPEFMATTQSSATVLIRDASPAQLAFERSDLGNLNLKLQSAPGSTQVLETSIDLQHWTPWKTNRLNGEIWEIPIPNPFAGAQFYGAIEAD